MTGLPTNDDAVTEASDPEALVPDPVVTVLITTYNQEDYLAAAIEGAVKQQTNFPFEIIIGEDCSTDRTRELALSYQRRFPDRIRVVYGSENVGAFHNSNRCFRRARGEFLAYCEGDDYWQDPHKLQKQVDYLRAHPECGLVHSDYDYLVHTFGAWRVVRAPFRPKRKQVMEGEIYRELLADMFVRTCTMMGRMRLLEQHYLSPLRTPVHAVGDRPIVLHMSKLAKIGYLDESLATYRRTPGSMTNIGHRKLLLQVKRKLDMYRSFHEAFPTDEAEWQRMQRICYRENLHMSFLAKDRAEFEAALAWLKRNDPDVVRSVRIAAMSFLMRIPSSIALVYGLRRSYNEIRLYLSSMRPWLG